MKIQPVVRQRRKEIRDEAKRILLGKVLFHPYFPHDIYINVSGIKEWLNQPHKHYAEKNEALLQLPELLLSSEYLGAEPDPKERDYIIASHLFRTQIADDCSWIIVNETIWNECWVHSISDNIPDKKEKQDLWTLPSGTAIRRGILKPCCFSTAKIDIIFETSK